jgi:hypothetical protein
MKVHSISDIITNSSQEYYVIQTKLSQGAFENLIDSIFDVISDYGNPFHTIKNDCGEYTITTDFYYWGFTYCPVEDDAAEQERFEKALDLCIHIKNWDSYQRG